MIRLTGFRQWADPYVDPKHEDYQWQYSVITPKGVVTSVEIERAREGLDDQNYFYTLSCLADRLKEKGLKEPERRSRDVLNQVVADIPVNSGQFFNWLPAQAPDRQLELRRWMLVRAIQRARTDLGEKVFAEGRELSGFPRILAVTPLDAEEIRTEKVLRIPRVAGPIRLDGKADEPCWGQAQNATGPLWWTWNTEAAMRASAGSPEEFKRMPLPSFAQAQFAADRAGCISSFSAITPR